MRLVLGWCGRVGVCTSVGETGLISREKDLLKRRSTATRNKKTTHGLTCPPDNCYTRPEGPKERPCPHDSPVLRRACERTSGRRHGAARNGVWHGRNLVIEGVLRADHCAGGESEGKVSLVPRGSWCNYAAGNRGRLLAEATRCCRPSPRLANPPPPLDWVAGRAHRRRRSAAPPTCAPGAATPRATPASARCAARRRSACRQRSSQAPPAPRPR